MSENETKEKAQIVVSKMFETVSLVDHQLSSFNNFINYGILNVFETEPPLKFVTKNNEHKILKFGPQYYVDFPKVIEDDRSVKPLYPYEALIRNIRYESNLEVDISEITTDEKGNELSSTLHKKIAIAKIPIMKGSCKCWTSNMSDSEKLAHRESLYDVPGYFIINGGERVLIAQERMNYNTAYVFPSKDKKQKFSFSCELRSVIPGVKTSVTKLNLIGKSISVALPFLKKEIPLGVVFKGYGILDFAAIKTMICPNEDRRFFPYLFEIEQECYFIQSVNDALDYIGSGTNVDPEMRATSGNNILTMENFPHLGISIEKKVLYLAYMARKLLLTALGDRPDDDRDHFSNKRTDVAGTLLNDLFRTVFKKFISQLLKCFSKKTYCFPGEILKNDSITKKIHSCMTSSNWGYSKTSKRTGVSQVLSRMTYAATLSHLRRLNTPAGKEGKMTKVRQLHESQYRVCCPCETPDGATVGLLKNYCLMSRVTNDFPQSTILEINLPRIKEIVPVEYDNYYQYYLDTNILATKVFLNGYWYGFLKEIKEKPKSDNIGDILQVLRQMRRDGYFSYDVSFYYDPIDNELRIFSDAGRTTKALMRIENGILVLDKYTKEQLNSMNWNNMIELGIVEYIDSVENMGIVTTTNVPYKGKENYRASHCSLDSSLILGVAGSLIPFPDHNQSPRNSYQACMAKQALGMYADNYNLRYDTLSYVMSYPQRSLGTTLGMDICKFNEMPSGVNAIVAIACYTGFNQEDGIIINRASVERGMFAITYYKTYTTESKKKNNYIETIEIPPKEIRGRKNYSKLDDDGIIGVGLPVGPGDVLVGKTLQKDGKDSPKTDCSIVLKGDEEGYVDSVALADKNGATVVKVKIRHRRVVQVGDKVASRAAQKSVCGLLANPEDLPFTKDGIVPDVVINPACMTSRMTMGHILETLVGKSSLLRKAKLFDATTFHGVDVEKDVVPELLKGGYEKYGKEIMYNGMTGKMIEAEIFIGPVYYQRLKHMVEDKVHSRTRGAVQSLTAQPAEGRSRGKLHCHIAQVKLETKSGRRTGDRFPFFSCPSPVLCF